MTALAVIMILVLGMIAAGNRTLAVGKRETQTGGARMAAEAGIELGYWQYAYNFAALPYTLNRNFGPGSVAVTVSDNTGSILGTVSIVSKGTVKGDSVTITRVIAKPKTVFDYAFAANNSIATNFFPVITGSGGQNGDIRANGYIQLNASGSKINGDATAQNAVVGTSVTGKQINSAAPLAYPTINTTYYQSIANRSFASAQTWSGFTFLVPYEVVYVNGDITLTGGSISGTGTLVCTGMLHFNGNLDYATASDKIAALAVGGLDTNGNNTVVGFYYGHNSTNNAYGNGNVNWNFTLKSGSLAADTYNVGSWSSTVYQFTHDPAMNDQLGKSLHLPGY